MVAPVVFIAVAELVYGAVATLYNTVAPTFIPVRVVPLYLVSSDAVPSDGDAKYQISTDSQLLAPFLLTIPTDFVKSIPP
jgi:hypothetical protein